MVCSQCIKVVTNILNDQKISWSEVTLGSVRMREPVTTMQRKAFDAALRQEGFELIHDQQSVIISAIKNELILLIHHNDLTEIKENISTYLSKKLHKDYSILSKLFSEMENLTIEQFVILQKIEKVKELLVYNQYNLSEIAYKMNYSSSAHLSGQFKKVTGFTPSQFKKLKYHNRKPLDEI